jgi:hypothetical protein
LQDLNIFRQAAANGDLFIKENANTSPVSPVATEFGSDDDEPSIL